jgi:hypothetical protein
LAVQLAAALFNFSDENLLDSVPNLPVIDSVNIAAIGILFFYEKELAVESLADSQILELFALNFDVKITPQI